MAKRRRVRIDTREKPVVPKRVPHPSRVLCERVGILTSALTNAFTRRRVPHFSRFLREVGILGSGCLQPSHGSELSLPLVEGPEGFSSEFKRSSNVQAV